VVDIRVEPDIVYLEESREANYLNFDFVVKGLTDKKLRLKFIKMAVYDQDDNLLTYRYLNHNAVGVPGIHTVGTLDINGPETIDLPNPFFQFSKQLSLAYLRDMFTYVDVDTHQEFYYGDIRITPTVYQQQTRLQVPFKGLMTILDGHDYYSHHRRFEMTLVRNVTEGKFASNFSRYALDFVLIGPDGNLSNLAEGSHKENYDFHFRDVRKFYTHGALVYAPADGEIVAVVNHLTDLYETTFNLDQAIQNDSIAEIAGNFVVIQHNEAEFSHLFHLLKGSIPVKLGEQVKAGQEIGKIGFSGAATTYSHLHYQLMDGPDFLKDNALPCKFQDVTLIENGQEKFFTEASLDSNDFVLNL
jgi:murein DD-endopeptidase MepM/ murein hydrolase activator NlpD